MWYSRRSFLGLAGGGVACVSAEVFAQGSTSETPYADKEAADMWIKQWMQSPGAATRGLHLGRFADRTYFLR